MSESYEHCDVVEVRWVDSCGFDSSWVDNEELKSLKPKQITTVGHLFERSDDYVVVAPTIGDEQNFGSICIPTCAIRSIETIVGRIDASFLHRGFDWRVKPKESRDEMD